MRVQRSLKIAAETETVPDQKEDAAGGTTKRPPPATVTTESGGETDSEISQHRSPSAATETNTRDLTGENTNPPTPLSSPQVQPTPSKISPPQPSTQSKRATHTSPSLLQPQPPASAERNPRPSVDTEGVEETEQHRPQQQNSQGRGRKKKTPKRHTSLGTDRRLTTATSDPPQPGISS